jgi:hypothetical protein
VQRQQRLRANESMKVDFMSGFPLVDDLAKNAQAERLRALPQRMMVVGWEKRMQRDQQHERRGAGSVAL